MSFLFCRITDPEFWPQIESHAFTDQSKGSADQGLACDNGGCRSDQDAWDQKPVWHDTVEHIVVGGIENLTHLVVQQPGSLAEIIQYQAAFHIDPGNPDIVFTAMSQVGIKSFCSGCT